jgi:hypothetical protein
MGKKAAAVAALIGLWILPAHAQSRGGTASHAFVARPAAPVRIVRSIPSPLRPRTVVSRNQSVAVNSLVPGTLFPGATVQDLFGFPVPGLGFDYVHVATVNSNLGVRALIDPVTQQEIALALRLQGANFGVSPFFFSPFGASPVVLESPAAVAPQQDTPAPAPIVVVAPPVTSPAPQTLSVAQEQPLPDPGEFVLVQRDGRLLFAVAFTGEPGRVIYVTKEGLRRTIALDLLDVDATLRMNEERGSSIQLPRS